MSKKNAQQSRTERAAAVRAAQERKERARRAWIVGAIVAALVLVVGIGFLVQSQRDTAGEEGQAPAAATEDHSLAIGEPDAPHKVVIYEDFLCPVCRTFESEVDEALTEAAGAGDVYVEYRPFELLSQFGDYSRRATNAFAVVLDTSGPEVAKEFHDRLYAEQPSEQGPFPDDAWLVELAVESGAEESDVAGPIKEMRFEQWVVNATDQASKAGVQGTPTVLLDGEQVGGGTIEEMVDNLIEGIS